MTQKDIEKKCLEWQNTKRFLVDDNSNHIDYNQKMLAINQEILRDLLLELLQRVPEKVPPGTVRC